MHVQRLATRALRCALLALGLALAGGAGAAQPALLVGTAWYPEQWPQSRWPKDLGLMQAAHLDVVRVGEFAWSTMEPREGEYDFSWLDRAIAEAARHHIYVVIGTPTAAPPAWLTSKYPDTLGVDEDGRREEHGNRQQFSFSSPRYRQLARQIATRLAERYGHNPDVIGWQIDNEMGPPSFDAETRRQFHAWLRHKYGDIASLNRHWTTAYWSETYDSFDEIPMHSKDENPGLLLDFRRFVSDTWASYIENQVSALRAHVEARQFITTNTTHWSDHYDQHAVSRELDMASWDEYVPDGHLVWLDEAVQHDLVRGYKGKNFWLMETQPAFVNWWPVNHALSPFAMRELAWQAVGHGADAVLYWQWRSALNGQEQYHGTLLGADGTPVPAYGVVSQIAAEMTRAAPALAGTSPRSEVAMLQAYDSRWAIDFQRHQADFEVVKEFGAFYGPLEHYAQSVDVTSPDAPLAGYRLVVAPALNVLSSAEARHLADYVRGGGHLVLGPRSGMKDAYDALWPQRQPGPLAQLLGGRVEEYYALDSPVPLSGVLGAGQASIWAEALSTHDPTTRVLMRYGKSNGWLDGRPAIISRDVGKGSITYIGAWLDPALMQNVLDDLLRKAHVAPLVAGISANIEICERVGAGKRVWILINHGDDAHTIRLPSPAAPVLAGDTGGTTATVMLAPHSIHVLEAPRR
ncbi:MAG: beta-galactosidase [Gammaproteobacteria bacterium]|nr:beta-galactosidase [Gammaproteobacteria bacterium]